MKTPRFLMSMLVTAGLSVLILSCNKTEADEALNVNQALGNPQNSLASNDSWKTINTQIFSIQVPAYWDHKSLPGIDTYTGLLTDGTNKLNYEYGTMPDTFPIDPERFRFHYEIIDGRRAKIIQGERTGIALDNVSEQSVIPRRFIMMQSSEQPLDRELALRIIRSLDFK